MTRSELDETRRMDVCMPINELRVAVVDDPYLSPEQVCELIPGMTKGNLAQLRHKGGGPTFRYATPRVIVYRRSDVITWLERQAHSRTDQPVSAA